MGVEGRLLLVELVILPGNDPSWGKLIDLQMLVQTPGGKERTESEYRGLLSRAGFELVNNRLTSCALNILEGRPV
jgi:hypothetical protein